MPPPQSAGRSGRGNSGGCGYGGHGNSGGGHQYGSPSIKLQYQTLHDVSY